MSADLQNPLLDDLLATVQQLFPEAMLKVGKFGNSPSALRIVPGRRHPRIAVPANNAPAASDALLRPSASDNFRTAGPRRLLAAALARPLGDLVMPYGVNISNTGNSITDYLTNVLDQPVSVSLMVGSARANRKPILNVHSLDGTEIGFAKVALSALTEGLVQHEGAVLEQLSRQRNASFIHPDALHTGMWNGHAVLLMTALRPDGPQRKKQLAASTAAGIIQSADVHFGRINSSAWLSQLENSATGLRNTPEHALPVLLDHYRRDYGAVEIPFGAWHGDFGPWNLAHTSTVPMVWDWERYATQVPAGMDVVHYLAHRELRRRGNVDAARKVLESVALPELASVLNLAAGISNPEPRLLKALQLGYLLTICTRFTLDSLTPGGAPVRALAHWHQDVMADQLRRPATAAFARK